jgi:HTH-type transcriptional repressor of NAD biosynthesis genes
MKSGLTLGKYAPLHRGHQFLIERALAEVDHLIVLVYPAPDVTSIPLKKRADWIRRLYPTVEVIEAVNGPTIVGASPEIQRLHEDYLRTLLGSRRVTHFYSSEFYGDHVSKALDAIDRRVDPAREQVPISATRIRESPFVHRAFVDPTVYWDLVVKAVILGAPSTGKTTLASELARELGTTWMPEYGREYWQQHHIDRRLTMDQLLEIACGHMEREYLAVADANQYLLVDTDATTTCMFSHDYHGAAHRRLEALADAARHRYDVFLLCGDDIPYEATWDRSGEVHRADFQKRIRADLRQRGTPFIELRGTLEARIAAAKNILLRAKRPFMA